MSRCCCSIAPPGLLARLVEEGDPEQRRAATRALATSEALRAHRALIHLLTAAPGAPAEALGLPASGQDGARTVYDAQHRTALPGRRIRGEQDGPVQDVAVDEAFDGAGATRDFYREVYGRDSVDGAGAALVSSVHYATDYDNAMWNGTQMVYGDGSGRIFAKGALTRALDVIGHELTHGVTQYTAGLEYSKQSGALNESFSDVFGSLVKQRANGQSADAADWLIGEGTLVPSLGRALRSMKAPGTAYDGDNQPATMDGYVDLPDDGDPSHDNGGVHVNSGIPNHAFYLAATRIGGNAWEKTGRIWYVTLTERTTATAQFADVAATTEAVAGELFGDGPEREAVAAAWSAVGVTT